MRKRPLRRANPDYDDKLTRRAVLCGSAVVAALGIRCVERWTGWDRVGEVEDPMLTECLRLLEGEDRDLVRRARSFLIRAQQFTQDPRIGEGLARLGGLVLDLPDEQADFLLTRCLELLQQAGRGEVVETLLSRCKDRPQLTRVIAWSRSRARSPR